MDPILEIEGISKSYAMGHQSAPALTQLSLKVYPGEFTALVGPSGSGKTTLLNLAGCLDLPDGGAIRVGGEDVTHAVPRRRAELRGQRIGFVFQTFNLIPVLSAWENVEYPLILSGKLRHSSPGEAARLRRRVGELLDEVGLSKFHHRRPDDMSGGQRQRVAIARALAVEPLIVLADEPTANLDRKTGMEIMALFERFNREHGATFLFATHDPLVMGWCRRIVRLVDGRVDSDEKQVPQAAEVSHAG